MLIYFTSQSGVCQVFYITFWYKYISMEIAKIVGNNIKNARKYKGMTQSDVAKKLCMTQQQYSRFENGIFELNYSQIIEICRLLDIFPNEIFGFEE